MATGHGPPHERKSRIASTMGKARILMEALPYIQRFRGRTMVVKYGGSAMFDPALRASFAGDVALLASIGIRPVVVHGGGPQIDEALAAAGIERRFHDGLRVTDEATLEVVRRVLLGTVNPDIVRLLGAHGADAVGLSGVDGGLLTAEVADPDLGRVGRIVDVDGRVIHRLLEDGFVPVVAPLAAATDGGSLNVNADTVAGVLAARLGAEKLVYLTDVEGLYRDLGDEDSLISQLDVAALRGLLADGTISAGMLPKLRSAVEAVEAGVARAHILDGRVQHALLLEIFTPEGIGTMVLP